MTRTRKGGCPYRHPPLRIYFEKIFALRARFSTFLPVHKTDRRAPTALRTSRICPLPDSCRLNPGKHRPERISPIGECLPALPRQTRAFLLLPIALRTADRRNTVDSLSSPIALRTAPLIFAKNAAAERATKAAPATRTPPLPDTCHLTFDLGFYILCRRLFQKVSRQKLLLTLFNPFAT